MTWIINYVCRKYADYEDIKAFKNTAYMYVVALLTLMPHIFFMFYFVSLDIPFMTAVNAVSCGVYVAALVMVRLRKHKAACLIITFEVMVYAFLSTLCFGPNVDAQNYIIPAILAQYLIFDFKQSERLYIAVVLCLVWYAAIFLNFVIAPLYPQDANWVLRRINLLFVVFFTLFQLMLNMLMDQIERAFYSRKISEVTEESYIDPLTQLKNRRYADNVYFKKITNSPEQRNICFVMMDIDFFKSINDKYGHEGGDLVLKSFGEILTRSLRSTDLVCRWGGEEFLIVMLDCDLNYSYIVVSKIKDTVSNNEVYYNGQPISFTFTAGICQYTNERIADVINKCDVKLYEGKNSGRNKIVF